MALKTKETIKTPPLKPGEPVPAPKVGNMTKEEVRQFYAEGKHKRKVENTRVAAPAAGVAPGHKGHFTYGSMDDHVQ